MQMVLLGEEGGKGTADDEEVAMETGASRTHQVPS